MAYKTHLLAAIAGDKRAFAEVVRLFDGMAQSVAERRLGNRDDALDAVQEAFLTAYLNLSVLRDPDAFPAWFRSILFTCSAKIARERARRPERLMDNWDAPSSDIDPLESCVRFQTREMVRRTLASLSGPEREACVQRYIYGRSYREIALILGVPVGTLKSRLHKSRERIIRSLRKRSCQAVRVGYLPISDHLLAMLAHHQSGGTQEIHLHKFLSWETLTKALVDGLLDAAFIMAPLAMALRNKGVPIVHVLDGHHEGSAITVKKDVDGKGPLKWGRMGLPHDRSTHALLLSAMGAEHEVRPNTGPGPKFISPSYLIGSLLAREIDAFFCAEPWSTKSMIEGSGRVVMRSRSMLPGHMCCVLVVREEFIAARGEMVRSLVRQVMASARTVEKDPARCGRIQSLYTGVSPGVAGYVLEQGFINFTNLKPDRTLAEGMMRLALNTGVIDAPCDLDRFVRADFV